MARRSGLGKGLGALIPTEAKDRGSVLRVVSMTSIRPNPLQPRTRFDEEAMTSLASSIREVGVLQPILVREIGEDEYELIAGERRWRAARRAGLQTMPVLVQSATDVHSLEQALVENLHREDLNPLEEAGAFQQLVDEFGYTHEQVAARVGKSRTVVTNTLRLLQLPAGVQRALADGVLSAGHARALLGTPDRSFQEDMAKRAVAEGLTVRAVEEVVRRHAAGAEADAESTGAATNGMGGSPQDTVQTGPGTTPGTVRRRLPAPGVLELEDLLSNHLNTRVKVEMGAKRGRVVIDFATLEDLERIYKLMVGAPVT
ncbi:MAG: ParB/RepB/Spo0J family partition protein [Acidimicrobiales bacterium]